MRFLPHHFGAPVLGLALLSLASPAAGEQRILPATPRSSMEFGRAVARYADWAVVGAPRDHWTFKGSARVLRRVDGLWEEQATLMASDGAEGDQYGKAIAIDDFIDPRIVVGAPWHADYDGAAYVYVFEGGSWQLEAELGASDGSSETNFGTAVAIFDDLLLVGAPAHDGNGTGSGLVYVFRRSGSTWSPDGTIEPDDSSADSAFGSSIALVGIGTTAIVGSAGHQHGGYPAPRSGSAYVFYRSGDTWTQHAELLPSDGWNDMGFGEDVAAAGLGLRVVVGAGGTLSEARAGSAYVYERAGDAWSEVARLDSGAGETRLGFGLAVAMSGDGNALVVGDPYWRDQDGTVFWFARFSGQWRRFGRWTPALATDTARVGDAVAMWTAGVLAGAPWDDGAAANGGAVFVSDELVFADGFESGGTSAWSVSAP